MMATVPHVTSGLELRKFQTDGFLLTRVYMFSMRLCKHSFNMADCLHKGMENIPYNTKNTFTNGPSTFFSNSSPTCCSVFRLYLFFTATLLITYYDS